MSLFTDCCSENVYTGITY